MKKGTALILFLTLTACFGGVSEPSRFYTLTPTVTTAVSETKALSVGIDRVQIARYLDRPQIITQSEDSAEMKLSETNRWIEPPADLIQRVLVDNLTVALPKAAIKTQTQSREDFTYTVSVDVTKMNIMPKHRAELEAWYLIQNKAGQIVARNKVSESAEVGASYDDMVRTQSDLIGRLATQIATRLAHLK